MKKWIFPIFLIVIIFLSLYFLKKNINDNLIKKIKMYLKCKEKKKIFAWILIFCLMVADYLAIFDMFRDEKIQTDLVSSVIFGCTFALCLEGFPTLLGASLGNLLSKVKARENDFKHALIGCIIGTMGSLVVIWLVFHLRGILIESRGGYDAFIAGSLGQEGYKFENAFYYENDGRLRFILDMFLRFSPILTSVMAFCFSWVWLRNDKKDVEKQKMDRIYDKIVYQTALYEDALHQFQNARIRLWTLVCNDKEMPIRPDVYRFEIFNRIREKLFHNCLDNLDTEMMNFNSEIETLLNSYITEMSKHSTVPDDILNMKLKNIIYQHDLNKEDKIKWDYSKAKDSIQHSLYITLKRDFEYMRRKTDMTVTSDYPEDL